jgi:hypothetical protein
MISAPRITSAVAGLLLLTGCVMQQPTSVTAPAYWRVRVYTTSTGGSDTMMLQGVVVWAEEDSLRIYHEQGLTHRTLPVSSIARLELYRGQRPTAGTAAKGAVAGTGIGAFLGALSSGASAAVLGAIWNQSVDIEEAVTYGAVEGAVEGAAVGLVAGATLGEAVWQAIPYHALREELCHCRLPPRVANGGSPAQGP